MSVKLFGELVRERNGRAKTIEDFTGAYSRFLAILIKELSHYSHFSYDVPRCLSADEI
jgi:hypothetical protein